jgi:quinol monooxygenase YgiN
MRKIVILLVGTIIWACTDLRAAVAADAAVYVATYVEIMPHAKTSGATLLKTEAAATRQEDGCSDVEVLGEIGRDERFFVFEIWRDRSAYEAHRITAHARQFRDLLAPIEIAPPDVRELAGLAGQPAATPGGHAIWVFTHVDVTPTYKDETASMLEALAGASGKEAGNLNFIVARQAERPNHFTVSETWADRASFEAHEESVGTRQFREKLAPMLGALYDQRVYQAVE